MTGKSLAVLLALAAIHPSGTSGQRIIASDAADTITIQSSILGRTRTAFVATPASHAHTTRSYPVILVLDGEYNFASTARTAETLARLGHIPEAVVVGIPNISARPQDRVYDMTPPGLSVSGSSRNEGGDRFLDFIERELLPYVAREYRGGGPVVLVGWSSGGVIGTYAAATRPGFPIVIAIDAPIFLEDGWLAQRLIERARTTDPQLQRPLRYVSVQAFGGWHDAHWSSLLEAAPATWKLKRHVTEGETHETIGFLATYEGLKFAFQDYSVAGAPIPPRAAASRAFAHYNAIEREFGVDLPPPQRVLDRLVFDLLVEGLIEPARRAVAWSRAGYGQIGDEAETEAMFERVQAQLPLAETVDQLLQTPPPTAAQIEPYVGTWRGTDGPNDDARFPMEIRIRIENGVGIAEKRQPDNAGVWSWRRLDYLKVLPDGVEFGSRNGMRPLGVMVWTGRMHGATLSGTARFRGIVLPLPDGRMPPAFTFSIDRDTLS